MAQSRVSSHLSEVTGKRSTFADVAEKTVLAFVPASLPVGPAFLPILH